jgi:hypothetical protein
MFDDLKPLYDELHELYAERKVIQEKIDRLNQAISDIEDARAGKEYKQDEVLSTFAT